jgi:hypothetical protein
MNAPATRSLAASTKPEVIEDLSFEDYLLIDAVHSTLLKNILVSARNAKARLDRPLRATDDLLQGRAGHTALFEPHMFERDYAVWRKADGRRDKRTEAYSNFLATHAGKCVITDEQLENAIQMREAVLEHPIAGPMIRQGGRSELTLVWTHQRTGMRCKARVDRMCGDATMGELKTCVDPSPKAFWQIARRLKYPVQFSFYRDGVIECLGVAPRVKCIAVQKKDCWDVVVHNVPLETLMAGASLVEVALDRLAESRSTGIWPGQAWDHEPDLHITAEDMSGAPETTDVTFDGEEI